MLHLHALLKRVTSIDQQVLWPYEQDIVRSIDKDVAPRLTCHMAAEARQEDVVKLVILQYLRTIIYKDAPLRIHQQLAGVAVARLHRYALKTVLLRILTHTIHRSHPEAPFLIAKQTLHVVIGQSQRVVCTEILVILMSVIAVQTSERAKPHLS